MEGNEREDQTAAPGVNPWMVWGGAATFLLFGIFGFHGTIALLLVIIVALLG
jgi:hypothetical protein